MADGQRRPAHGPGGADQQRGDRQQRITDAAIDEEEQQRDAGDGQPGREARILLGGGHLVGFQHRHPGQAEFEVGKSALGIGDDRAHGLDALQRGGERALLLDGPDQQKGQRAIAAEEILRLGQESFCSVAGLASGCSRDCDRPRVDQRRRRRATDGQELREELVIVGQSAPGWTGGRHRAWASLSRLSRLSRVHDSGPRSSRQTHVLAEMLPADRLDLLRGRNSRARLRSERRSAL